MNNPRQFIVLLFLSTICLSACQKTAWRKDVNQEQVSKNEVDTSDALTEKIHFMVLEITKDSIEDPGMKCSLQNAQISPGTLKQHQKKIPTSGNETLLIHFLDEDDKVLDTQIMENPLEAYTEYVSDDEGSLGRIQTKQLTEHLVIRVPFQSDMKRLTIFRNQNENEKQALCSIELP